MRNDTPFGACVEYLCLPSLELAKLLAEQSGTPFSPLRAERVRDGLDPVPAFAWQALRQMEHHADRAAKMLVETHRRASGGPFQLSTYDLANSRQRRVALRALLRLDPTTRVELVHVDEPTFGGIGVDY